jgi:hypothetical protein
MNEKFGKLKCVTFRNIRSYITNNKKQWGESSVY